MLGKFWAESNVWGDLAVVEAVQRSKVTGLKAGSLAMDFTNFGPPNVRFVVYFLTLHVIADPLDQQCDEINACLCIWAIVLLKIREFGCLVS